MLKPTLRIYILGTNYYIHTTHDAVVGLGGFGSSILHPHPNKCGYIYTVYVHIYILCFQYQKLVTDISKSPFIFHP